MIIKKIIISNIHREVLVAATLQPRLDQAELARSQLTHSGLPIPSSFRCFSDTTTGAWARND